MLQTENTEGCKRLLLSPGHGSLVAGPSDNRVEALSVFPPFQNTALKPLLCRHMDSAASPWLHLLTQQCATKES